MTIIDDRTARNIPLPHASNALDADVQRLREALQTISDALDVLQAGQTITLTGGDRLLGRASAGAGVAEEIDCSAAGRALLAAAGAAAQLSLLGGASTADVETAVANLVASAPAALDTLNELATALGNDANFATTITNALAGKQPLHAVLTALAGLSPVADRIAYFTGAGTAALSELSAGGRALVALAGAADTLAYYTTANTAATSPLTATGRSLIGAANAAAVLSVLGLASAAKTDVAQTWSKPQSSTVQTISGATGTVNLDLSQYKSFRVVGASGAAITLGFTNVPSADLSIKVELVQPSSGSVCTVAWGSSVVFEGTAPSVTVTLGATDVLFGSTLTSGKVLCTLKKGIVA